MNYAKWEMFGGIHPPEHKQESTATAIQAASLPERLIIPMLKYSGKEANPIVAEKVLKGQKIGEAVLLLLRLFMRQHREAKNTSQRQ